MALRILVADADRNLGTLLSKSLGNAGHEVTVVNDAAGIRTALSRGGRADVIVIDPDLLGSRVDSVLESRAEARIFLCTSREPDDKRVEAVRGVVGDVEILKKPFSILDLEARLRDLQAEMPGQVETEKKRIPRKNTRREREKVRARTTRQRDVAKEDSFLIRRLEREWRELAEASPREVLGLPAGVDLETVESSARRMMERYGGLARDTESARVRRLSQNLEGLVQKAWSNFKSEESSPKQAPVPEPQVVAEAELSEEERLLALGQRLVKAESWEEADRALTKANQLDLGDPVILACLGWARIHNPSLDADDRLEEGVEYLILGEQFGPKEVQGLIYLVQGLEMQGRLDAALSRASRGLKLDPDNAQIRGLARRLRAIQSAD